MAELYTELRALKLVMNGGQMPPMTPVPENVQHFIDPAFVPGLGALCEDAEKGLRCPVRGCGEWRHQLQRHLTARHKDIGGAVAVRRALSIPSTSRLESLVLREQKRRRSLALVAEGRMRPPTRLCEPGHRQSLTQIRVERRTRSRNAVTMGSRNLRNACTAQLTHRIIDLHHALGRTPTKREAAAHYTPGLVTAIERAFGTWENAVALCGLERVDYGRTKRMDSGVVLEGLRAFFQTHGTLPSSNEARNPHRSPVFASVPTVLRAMRCDTWDEAMRRAAALLDIYGGRYGLPESVRPKRSA